MTVRSLGPMLHGHVFHGRVCRQSRACHIDPQEFVSALPIPEHRRDIERRGRDGGIAVVQFEGHTHGETHAGIVPGWYGPSDFSVRGLGAVAARTAAVLKIDKGDILVLPNAILV